MTLRAIGLLVPLVAALFSGCGRVPSSDPVAVPTDLSPTDLSPTAELPSDPAATDPAAALRSPSPDAKAQSFYTVDKYDQEASPSADLARTVTLASAQGKRIILEIGGEW